MQAISVRPSWDERCIFLTLTRPLPKGRGVKKGEKMNPTPQPQETNLQERAVETLTDNSLPAAQVIEEQNNDVDAAQNNAPRFIP